MRLILQEKIPNLGGIGDEVKVKPGYARNFLLPQAKAVVATEENKVAFEQRRAGLEKAAAKVLEAAQERAKSFEGVVFKIEAHASEEGKLFGSVGAREIVEASLAAGLTLEKSPFIATSISPFSLLSRRCLRPD